MKKLTIIYFLIFSTYILNSKASSNYFPDPRTNLNSCLELEGKITNACNGTDSQCSIALFCGKELVETLWLKYGKKKFRLFLSKNLKYSIIISKKGHVSRLINIDTQLPNGKKSLYRFHFTTTLLKSKEKKLEVDDTLTTPLATIYFHSKRGYFFYKKQSRKKQKDQSVKAESLLTMETKTQAESSEAKH